MNTLTSYPKCVWDVQFLQNLCKSSLPPKHPGRPNLHYFLLNGRQFKTQVCRRRKSSCAEANLSNVETPYWHSFVHRVESNNWIRSVSVNSVWSNTRTEIFRPHTRFFETPKLLFCVFTQQWILCAATLEWKYVGRAQGMCAWRTKKGAN